MVGLIKKVKDLEHLDLIQFNDDIDHVAEQVGNPRITEFGNLLVKINDGEYEEIWGVAEAMPRLEAEAEKVL